MQAKIASHGPIFGDDQELFFVGPAKTTDGAIFALPYIRRRHQL